MIFDVLYNKNEKKVIWMKPPGWPTSATEVTGDHQMTTFDTADYNPTKREILIVGDGVNKNIGVEEIKDLIEVEVDPDVDNYPSVLADKEAAREDWVHNTLVGMM